MDNTLDFLVGQTYKTKTGLVYLSECETVSYEIEFALTRLLDLHLRATKQVPIIDTEKHFSSKAARDLFSVAVSAMNASLLTFTDEQIEYFLEKLLDTCLKAQSTKGFESVFFTALASYSGDNDFLKEYYFQKFTSMGGITELGGGFNNSYYIDKVNGAYIGFDDNINNIIHQSKFDKKSYSNFSNRILSGKGIVIDSTTGIAISSATMLTNVAGAVAVGGMLMLGYLGYKTYEAKEEIKKEYNEAWEEMKKSDPDNKADEGKPGAETDKDSDDDSDDDFPEKPESNENPEGCIINPMYGDYKTDPYSHFSKRRDMSILPIGKGFRTYNFRTENNIYTVSKMPRLEVSKTGLANLPQLGFLNDFPNFKAELEKRQLEHLKTLQPIQNKPINKTGLFSDQKNTPAIDDIKALDPGFAINTQTYTHTSEDEAGNETVTTEEVNTIVFSNPALIALYGNSISISSDHLESMIKFFKMLSKANNTGVIDVPKNAGEFKLNKYL